MTSVESLSLTSQPPAVDQAPPGAEVANKGFITFAGQPPRNGNPQLAGNATTVPAGPQQPTTVPVGPQQQPLAGPPLAGPPPQPQTTTGQPQQPTTVPAGQPQQLTTVPVGQPQQPTTIPAGTQPPTIGQEMAQLVKQAAAKAPRRVIPNRQQSKNPIITEIKDMRAIRKQLSDAYLYFTTLRIDEMRDNYLFEGNRPFDDTPNRSYRRAIDIEGGEKEVLKGKSAIATVQVRCKMVLQVMLESFLRTMASMPPGELQQIRKHLSASPPPGTTVWDYELASHILTVVGTVHPQLSQHCRSRYLGYRIEISRYLRGVPATIPDPAMRDKYTRLFENHIDSVVRTFLDYVRCISHSMAQQLWYHTQPLSADRFLAATQQLGIGSDRKPLSNEATTNILYEADLMAEHEAPPPKAA